MKASELISEIQKIIDKHGDLGVCLWDRELLIYTNQNEIDLVDLDEKNSASDFSRSELRGTFIVIN